MLEMESAMVELQDKLRQANAKLLDLTDQGEQKETGKSSDSRLDSEESEDF